jgi:phospholipase/carboxylesterase
MLTEQGQRSRLGFLEASQVCFLPPARPGKRPRTPRGLPHIQLDQFPPAEIAQKLVEQSLRLADLRSQQSRMASPLSHALSLPDRCAGGPPAAFIDEHEFCHLHPAPDCSIHLTLPNPLRDRIVQLGWAEPHRVVRCGVMPATLVLVYAPRDYSELAVVLHLIRASYEFARGDLRDADGLSTETRVA